MFTYPDLNSLYTKLAGGLFAVMVFSGLIFVFISTFFTRSYMQELSQKLNTDLAKNLVAERNLVAEGRVNRQAIIETFSRFMTVNPAIEIYLLDLNGNIKAYSADPKRIKRMKVSLSPIEDFLNMTVPFPLLGDDPRSINRRKAFSVTAIPSRDKPEGYLYVVLRGEQYDFVERAVRDNYIFRLGLWAVIASLGIGLLAGLLVFRVLTRRLEVLDQQIDAFGNFDGLTAIDNNRTPLPISANAPGRGGDEVDRLRLTFQQMTDRINTQFRELKQKDALRRHLVAQIGHDLRTPLASLQGYIESLQIKDSELSAEEKTQFLDVALRQSRRLSGMIEELIELAALDAREQIPEMEPFSLVELIYDVTQKHRMKAAQKDITMTVAAAPELPLILGNVGMTERVLDNLLANALHHTPAGGHIDLGLQEKENGLRISVCDSGPGIDARDIPAIFEPFYQGVRQPDANALATADGLANTSHGSGLGLTIAKRMVELQGGVLEVRNAGGRGAEFIFRLPVYKSTQVD